MFYHNALLLSSCCASSNTYIGRESALAFPPPAFSHSCMLLTFFFLLLLCLLVWEGVFCKLQRITGWEKSAAIHETLLKTRLRAEGCCGLGRWVLPPARSRGAGCLAAVQAGTSLSSNFPCRNSARCRQPDKAALTLIEIFSLVMLEHQSNQQRSGRI